MNELRQGIQAEHLARIYTDPFMLRISDDGQPMYPVFHERAHYVSAFADGEFMGAYLVIRYTDTEWELHSLLLKKATKHSREFGCILLDWVFSDDRVLRATGLIREGLNSAVNHCIKMGFKREGFRRNAVLVGGRPMGIHILGITREDWRSRK